MRRKLLNGVNAVADLTKITLGPKGRSVILERKFQNPLITKDGVTTNHEVELEDSVENLGAQIVKEASARNNSEAGDGTTTVTVLAQSICQEGFKNIAAGADPLALKRGLDKAKDRIIEALKTVATPITGDKLLDIATISANDAAIGKIVAEAITDVGSMGVVTVESNNVLGLTKEIVKGMKIDKGFISPYMITNPDRGEAEYENVSVLLTDEKITTVREIIPILDKLNQQGKKELVLICDDIEGEALATLILNRLKGTFLSIVIKMPGYGENKKEYLQDLAVVTGATPVTSFSGKKLENTTLNDLGMCRRVVATQHNTVFVDGAGKEEAIKARVAELENKIASDLLPDFEKEKLRKRVASLMGGIGVIKIGAGTEMEMLEKKARIEDAICATKAALEEGIVVGGGVALLRAKEVLNEVKGDDDEMLGVKILRRALEEPFRQIVSNAGKDGVATMEKVLQDSNFDFGYNAKTGVYEDLMLAGVIDPLKVVRQTVENAVSAAGTLLTSEAAVIDVESKKHNKPLKSDEENS